MNTNDLPFTDYPEYYQRYISKLPQEDLISLLEAQKLKMNDFFKKISQAELNYSYAENKWTVAQVLQHLIDTERIFQYRALRIARKDKTPLAGFDQNTYVPNSLAHERLLQGFVEEYNAVRESGIALFKSLDDTMLRSKGECAGGKLSAVAAGFIIVGHERHHLLLFETKYQL